MSYINFETIVARTLSRPLKLDCVLGRKLFADRDIWTTQISWFCSFGLKLRLMVLKVSKSSIQQSNLIIGESPFVDTGKQGILISFNEVAEDFWSDDLFENEMLVCRRRLSQGKH